MGDWTRTSLPCAGATCMQHAFAPRPNIDIGHRAAGCCRPCLLSAACFNVQTEIMCLNYKLQTQFPFVAGLIFLFMTKMSSRNTCNTFKKSWDRGMFTTG